uniref:Reverse transcriptase domain-containing protein n=1 Tax=Amphimedon queenslandica TaxID=400682 RepID=A0A1X7UDV3_AMPQE
MVPKKSNGDWRPCGDYMAMNRITVPEQYPFPHIQDFASTLHGIYIVSKLDLVCACHPTPVTTEDVHKTAVTTPFELFEFTRTPFGLSNAAQTFQCFMDKVLHGLEFTYVYNDVLVASSDEVKHKNRLTQIFDCFKEYGVFINPDKCEFGLSSLHFLGHIVNVNGIRPSESKVSAVLIFLHLSLSVNSDSSSVSLIFFLLHTSLFSSSSTFILFTHFNSWSFSYFLD